jgi:hypothetical protein
MHIPQNKFVGIYHPSIESHLSITKSNAMLKNLLFCLLFTLTTYGQIAMATEEPPYTVTLAEGSFEIREYPSLIAAEVTVTPHDKALR